MNSFLIANCVGLFCVSAVWDICTVSLQGTFKCRGNVRPQMCRHWSSVSHFTKTWTVPVCVCFYFTISRKHGITLTLSNMTSLNTVYSLPLQTVFNVAKYYWLRSVNFLRQIKLETVIASKPQVMKTFVSTIHVVFINSCRCEKHHLQASCNV